MQELDSQDRLILALLRENARIAVVDIASKLRLSRATVQNHINRLERDGIILGYTVRLRADIAGRADPVIHHHAAPQALTKLGANSAGNQINACAGRKGHDQAQAGRRRIGIGICIGGCRRWRLRICQAMQA